MKKQPRQNRDVQGEETPTIHLRTMSSASIREKRFSSQAIYLEEYRNQVCRGSYCR
jgi:hypothetical protein